MHGWYPPPAPRARWSPAPQPQAPSPAVLRRKVFVSYHHDDQWEVERFIGTFGRAGGVVIHRALGVGMADDIINSTNSDYVMQRIGSLYLKDSTVTVVLIGRCTWARRYVDWEIHSALHES